MEEWFSLGSQLSCTTCLGTKIDGRLVAYDIASKFMILRKGKSVVNGCGDGSSFDFVLVNMANISAIDELEATPIDVEAELEPPANIDLKKLKEKLESSKTEKMLQASLGDKGVTPHGLAIYDKLIKTLGSQRDTVTWNAQGQIEIFGDVVISTPFTLKSLSMKHEDCNPNTLNHVKKVVSQYYKENKITFEEDKPDTEEAKTENTNQDDSNVWSSRLK